ncbi:MAG TPA: hypothetical protein VMM81_07705 [Acidimicrobiia bacterium]|nr:hypothetical protein [Acidimicrobiia bacterium]
MTKTLRALVGALTISLLVAACGGSAGDTTTTTSPTTTVPTSGDVIAEFRTPDGETYRVLLTGVAAAQARAAFAAGENPGIPNGYIERGDGEVNLGHDWHIRDVEFADMTIEVCDGTVSYIDDLGYDEFVNQHGNQFCPWGAELVDLVEP